MARHNGKGHTMTITRNPQFRKSHVKPLPTVKGNDRAREIPSITQPKKHKFVNADGKVFAILSEVPELPPEIEHLPFAVRWWDTYWKLLIASNQAIEDFIPSILTLCSMRQDFHTAEDTLNHKYPIHTKIGEKLAKSKLLIGRNISALEGDYGFTLSTNTIRNVKLTRSTEEESKVPKSVNPLHDTVPEESPYFVPDSE
jgi:hypothetical protein